MTDSDVDPPGVTCAGAAAADVDSTPVPGDGPVVVVVGSIVVVVGAVVVVVGEMVVVVAAVVVVEAIVVVDDDVVGATALGVDSVGLQAVVGVVPRGTTQSIGAPSDTRWLRKQPSAGVQSPVLDPAGTIVLTCFPREL